MYFIENTRHERRLAIRSYIYIKSEWYFTSVFAKFTVVDNFLSGIENNRHLSNTQSISKLCFTNLLGKGLRCTSVDFLHTQSDMRKTFLCAGRVVPGCGAPVVCRHCLDMDQNHLAITGAESEPAWKTRWCYSYFVFKYSSIKETVVICQVLHQHLSLAISISHIYKDTFYSVQVLLFLFFHPALICSDIL